MMEQAEQIKIHYNLPQLLFEIAKCRQNVCLWGRRTGKSEGPMASFTIDNIIDMPRSNGFLVGTTYTQLLTRTLPPLIAGWERLGFIQNEHFWIKKFAPDKLRLPKAYRHPVTAEHYIQFYNGSGIYLVSQDRPGTINGVATQWGAGDEAKFLNHEKLQEEALLTLSGGFDKFGDKWNYLSTLFCSDMPTNPSGRWLIDIKEQMDPKAIEMLIALHFEAERIALELEKDYNPSNTSRRRASIARIENMINELKKVTTYYSLASTFDNIHALGMDVFKNFFRQLDSLTFLTSILNEFLVMIENCFYASLNPYHHGYDNNNYNYVDEVLGDLSKIPERDCRWDGDLHTDLPLDISCDYNYAINSVVTGQQLDYLYERRFVSSMYVLKPNLLGDLVTKWCDYYEHHKCRDVNYIYDQTAVAGKADSEISFADQWIAGLRARGWNVNPIYIGEAPRHRSRHYLFNIIAQERNSSYNVFRYNRENCSSWQVSCERAGVIQGGSSNRDFKKDKRSERQTKVPPQEATHLSEAGDTLFWYYFSDCMKDQPDFMDMMAR